MNMDAFSNGLERDKMMVTACTTDDANIATNCLQNILTKQLDIWAPYKTIQLKTNFLNYLTQETKELIVKRDLKLKEARKDSDKPEIWLEYKNLRNKVVTQTRNDEINYNTNLMKGENQWKNAKKILNINQPKAPSMLKINNEIVNDATVMCDKLNKFFIKKPENLKKI